MNYRLLGYVFDQKRIRGAVWRLVWRGVQSALYGLSNALKATVTGKVEGRDAAEGELGVCARELGWIKNAEIQEKNQQKVLCLYGILQM